MMLLGLLTFSISALAQISSSKWQTQPIVIDGDGSDWGLLPRFFNSESNVKYEFRNDAQNLYIILKAADRTTHMQLMIAGFSVKLKVKSSTPTKISITFPPKKRTEMPPMTNNPEGRADRLVNKSLTEYEISFKDTAILDGFQFTNGIITSENKDAKNICFAKGKSNHELATYEIRIPLIEVFGNNFNLDNISNIPIQLQVQINDLSQNEKSKMKGRMNGGMHHGEGHGMRGGGQMGGEMLGGNIREMSGGEMGEGEMQSGLRGNSSMERKSFNIDFKLSTGK